MSAKKDIRQMVQKLCKQGWTAELRRSGHWRLPNPAGRWMTCAWSPKGNNALQKARQDARKLGADI